MNRLEVTRGWCVFAALGVLLAACTRALPAGRTAPPRDLSPSADIPLLWPTKTSYRKVLVHGRQIFYREAGEANRPVLLLLHGFPASSHAFRELIPLLSGRYHVIAPDYLGSGFSERPSPHELTFTFDLLARHVTGFTEALGLTRYVIYMHDFGAPVGFRVALAHPERVRGLIIQNANAYLEGLTGRRAFFQRAHDDRSPAGLAALAAVVSPEGIRERQYLRDVPGERQARMSPDTWTHDLARMSRDDDRAIQVQLFQDYQTNVDAYPSWQRYLREHRPPALIVWGERDPAFVPAGAKAYLRDLPDAELHLLDAGHFALEEMPTEIAQFITAFLERLGTAP